MIEGEKSGLIITDSPRYSQKPLHSGFYFVLIREDTEYDIFINIQLHMAILQDLRNTFYGILSESESSTDYSPIIADKFLNKAQLLICTWGVVNPKTWEEVKKGRLPFLDSNAFYSSVNDTTVGSNGFALSATTIPVASTLGFLSSGYVYIDGCIIKYTGTTSTSFTGCTGVLIAGTSGKKVAQAFQMPSDYNNAVECIFDHSFRVPYKDYRNLFQNATNNPMARYTSTTSSDIRSQYFSPFYTIQNVWGVYFFIPFNLNTAGKYINFKYEKKPTKMTAVWSACTIPDDEMADIIAYLAVAEMLYNRGQEDSGMNLYATLAIPQLSGLYTFYNRLHAEDQFNTRVSTAKDVNLNI